MMQFAVIGDPIAHSLSPLLHQEIYRQLDIDASFEKIQVKLDSLASFMTQNELDGFNVTVPYKQSIIPFLDELDESARTIGAVNCVHHGKGHNTDWVGFLKAMDINDIVLEGMDCIILGAGGAARAVAYALVQAGVKSISVQNRTREKGNQLLNWINSIFQKNEPREQFDVIINCTPIGMWPDTDSIPDIPINEGQVLADIVYNPLETKWLISGKQKGAFIVGGLDMFIFQGMASIDIWFDKNISEKIELEPIKKVLKSELC